MWCSKCEQTVSADESSQDDGRACCARCGNAVTPALENVETPADVSEDFDRVLTAIPLDWDEWEIDDEFPCRGAEARRANATGSANSAADGNSVTIAKTTRRRRDAERTSRRRRSAPSQFFSWAVLSFSLMAFACGAVLVGWSFFTGRGDLWRLGMPLTLIGQTGWLIGMVLQLDGLWQSNRDTGQTLDELDRRLDELRQAAELLSSSRSGASQSFYAHLAEGASPGLLLADLKGQLDLLATQLERRAA